MRIAVPDLRLSNLRSARRALEALGHEAATTSDPVVIARARQILLPGVGAFGEAARRLEETGIGDAIRRAARDGAGIVGICLGMQLLFESSEEGGEGRGLGLLPGRAARLAGDAAVPHVGWNRVRATRRGVALFEGVEEGADFYFVHSFVVRPASEDFVLARCRHGENFPAAAGSGRILGFQFHPEKSGPAGVRLLGRALERVAEGSAGE